MSDEPPIVGLGAQITFYCFLVVMLLVPLIVATDPNHRQQGLAPTSESRFSSDRERRLWIWTAMVLLALYTTLGPVAELAAELRERNLLRVTSTVVLLLVVAVFAVPWLKRRPGRREVAAALGVAAVYLTTMVRLPVPEARSHLFEYGLVGMLIYQALTERRNNGRRVPVPAVTALVATVILGWLDEAIQYFLPNRTYDLLDVGFNAIAATMGISAIAVLSWARSWDVFKQRSGPAKTPAERTPPT